MGLNLHHVAVIADLVGLEVLVALGEMVLGLGFTPRPADSARGVDDDVRRIDEPRHERNDAQSRRRRVAARVCDHLRGADLVAEQLGQAVDRVLEVVQVDVGLVIPLLVVGGFLQAVVGQKSTTRSPTASSSGTRLIAMPLGRQSIATSAQPS